MMLVSQLIAGDALESHVAPLRPTLFVKEFLFLFFSNNIQLVTIFGKLFFSTKWAFYVESRKKLVMIEC